MNNYGGMLIEPGLASNTMQTKMSANTGRQQNHLGSNTEASSFN